MPAADRLPELRRQRAQIQDHLAWLDREIAAEEKKAPPPGASAAQIGGANATRPLGAPPAAAAAEADVSAAPAQCTRTTASPAAPATSSGGTPAANAAKEAEAVMDEYRVPAADLQKDVRNGCLLYFAAAVLILAGIVAVLYYALRR